MNLKKGLKTEMKRLLKDPTIKFSQIYSTTSTTELTHKRIALDQCTPV